MTETRDDTATAQHGGTRDDQALTGLRVLDFTTVMAGPFCTRLLADLGADVIKVESPDGDHIRVRPPLRTGPHGPRSSYFGQLNCGKRSVVLNLKQPEDRATALRMAGAADVLVENFRPGVMDRLGLDYPTLAARHPGLVYCSISGYGQTGPASERPAYAPIIHAASGYDLTNLGYQDGVDTPPSTGVFIADVFGGVYAFGAIQAALLHRARTGTGQAVDVSLLETMLALQVFEVQQAQFPGDRRRPLYRPLRTSDGHVVVAPVSQRNFEHLITALGRPAWADDPRFTTQSDREHHWDALLGLLEQWTVHRTALDCERTLLAAGVACSRYVRVAELLTDPQLAHRGALATVRDSAGSFLVPNAPFRLSGGPVRAGAEVPELGADGPLVHAALARDPATDAWPSPGRPEERAEGAEGAADANH